MSLKLKKWLFPINDVSTSTDSPPQFSILSKNRSRSMSYNPKFAARQARYYPDIGPIVSQQSPDRVYAAIEKLAAQIPGWREIQSDKENLHLEAVAVTKQLRFKDDIVMEVRPHSGHRGCKVHMRSRSRLGRSDFDANAQRIRYVFRQLKSNLNEYA